MYRIFDIPNIAATMISSLPLYLMLFAQAEMVYTNSAPDWKVQLGVAGAVGTFLSTILLYLAKKYDGGRDEQLKELKEQNKEVQRKYEELLKSIAAEKTTQNRAKNRD